MNRDLPPTLRVVIVWLLLGVAVFLGVQWWQREAQRTRFEVQAERIEIRRGPDGHYHWPGTINGRPVEFLVDTGATGTAIPLALSRELGLASQGEVLASTAGGTVRGELVVADVALHGGIRAERLRLTALPGLADRPLLGMNVLGRLHWQQRDGVLIVDRPGRR